MTTPSPDEPRDVREGDSFDVAAGHAWLRQRFGCLDEPCRRVAGIG